MLIELWVNQAPPEGMPRNIKDKDMAMRQKKFRAIFFLAFLVCFVFKSNAEDKAIHPDKICTNDHFLNALYEIDFIYQKKGLKGLRNYLKVLDSQFKTCPPQEPLKGFFGSETFFSTDDQDYSPPISPLIKTITKSPGTDEAVKAFKSLEARVFAAWNGNQKKWEINEECYVFLKYYSFFAFHK